MSKIQSDQSKIIEFEDNVSAWIDESTHLMWEVKNSDNIRYMYVWHKRYVDKAPVSEGPGSGKEIHYETEVMDATSYVERLNRNMYAGFCDWRIPEIEELESLIAHDGGNYFIKKPLQNNTRPAYWSDTHVFAVNNFRPKGTSPYYMLKDNAYIPGVKIVDFQKPITAGYKPENSLWLRCVRSHESEKIIKFNSFDEAKAWAKEHPGKVITKSPDGTGYIIKDEE